MVASLRTPWSGAGGTWVFIWSCSLRK